MTVRILLADDHKIIRDGLQSLLEKDGSMEVIAFAENGREAVKLAQKLKPDVVIMDVSMPDLNGIDATRQILDADSGIKVIALSIYSDRRFVEGMVKAGASGYLLKDCAFEELARAIQTVVSGQTYLSPGVAGTLVRSFVDRLGKDEANDGPSSLTDREREVLQLVAEGKPTREIASVLNVSVKTVESHRKRIMNKLDIHSVAELTKFAIREGLTSL
jgi:DNA-binding NarL/FixJ family response regulator